MTSVEAPVLCLQKQPDQTQTPGRCPESHTSAQCSKNWIIRLRISPKRPSSLEVFPKLSLYKWAKVGCHHAPMDFFWFRLGLDSIPTNIISHTIIIISPRASLLHSFQCLWAHNPSKDLQKTILSSRKNKKKPAVSSRNFSSKNFPGLKFLQMIRPNLSENWDEKPQAPWGPLVFYESCSEAETKGVAAIFANHWPAFTNKPPNALVCNNDTALPSLLLWVVCFRFLGSRAVNWNWDSSKNHSVHKYAEVVPNCIQWSCDVSQFPKLHTAKRLLKKGATTRSAGSWFQCCICCGSQLDARLWLLVFDSAVNWASLHTTIRWPADLTSSTPGHAHAEKRQG